MKAIQLFEAEEGNKWRAANVGKVGTAPATHFSYFSAAPSFHKNRACCPWRLAPLRRSLHLTLAGGGRPGAVQEVLRRMQEFCHGR